MFKYSKATDGTYTVVAYGESFGSSVVLSKIASSEVAEQLTVTLTSAVRLAEAAQA